MNYRQQLIAEAIRLAGEATLDALHVHLPTDFDLQQVDLDEMPPVGSLLAVEPTDLAAGTVAEVDDSDLLALEPVLVTPTAEVVSPQDRLDAAVKALAAARADNSAAHYAEHDALNALSAAVTQFQSGFPRYSADELRRDWCRQQAAERAAVAKGAVPPTQTDHAPGNSVIDRQAFYSKGGGLEHGRYGSYRRTEMVKAHGPGHTPAVNGVAVLAVPGKRV